MSQVTSGICRLVGIPRIYSALQVGLGGSRARRIVVDDLMQPPSGGRVLDFGCGPADILHSIRDTAGDYLGIDSNPRHIRAARVAHGERGRFFCNDFAGAASELGDSFDLVIMVGLLHHLSDDRAVEALTLAHSVLGPKGRLFTMAPCYEPGQYPIARFLINRDAGRAVRDAVGYNDLASALFADVRLVVRHGILRVPYTHCRMNCLPA